MFAKNSSNNGKAIKQIGQDQRAIKKITEEIGTAMGTISKTGNIENMC